MTAPRWLSVAGAVALAAAAPDVCDAQTTPWQLPGIVRSTAGPPISSAIIQIGAVTARADSLGRFSIQATRRDSLTLTVKRLGFSPVSTLLGPAELTGDTLLVLMDENAQMIQGVMVEATATCAPRSASARSRPGGHVEPPAPRQRLEGQAHVPLRGGDLLVGPEPALAHDVDLRQKDHGNTLGQCILDRRWQLQLQVGIHHDALGRAFQTHQRDLGSAGVRFLRVAWR